MRDRAIPRGHRFHAVPVAHPHPLDTPALEAREQVAIVVDRHVGGSVLSPLGARHAAPAELAENAHAVADSEHGPAVEQRGVDLRRFGIVDARRPARENQPLGIQGGDLLGADVEWMNLAVDAGLPDPPCNELRVLAAEIEDEDHSSR